MSRSPCKTCPWKQSTPRHGFPGGRICLDGLNRAIHGSIGDAAMQCHSTPDGDAAKVCVGFAQAVGFESVPLRMAAVFGRYNPDEIAPVSEPLHTPTSLLRFHGAAKE